MSMVKIASSAPSAPLRNDARTLCDDEKIELHWKDSIATQKLLDVIASIIADEYIQVAKQNKDVFEIASSRSSAAPHNDERKMEV